MPGHGRLKMVELSEDHLMLGLREGDFVGYLEKKGLLQTQLLRLGRNRLQLHYLITEHGPLFSGKLLREDGKK